MCACERWLVALSAEGRESSCRQRAAVASKGSTHKHIRTHSRRSSPLGPAEQHAGGSTLISASSFWMRRRLASTTPHFFFFAFFLSPLSFFLCSDLRFFLGVFSTVTLSSPSLPAPPGAMRSGAIKSVDINLSKPLVDTASKRWRGKEGWRRQYCKNAKTRGTGRRRARRSLPGAATLGAAWGKGKGRPHHPPKQASRDETTKTMSSIRSPFYNGGERNKVATRIMNA